MDIGEIFTFRIGMPGKIAHARAVDRCTISEIAEGNAHRLNAVPHRQQPFHILIGDDDRHVPLFDDVWLVLVVGEKFTSGLGQSSMNLPSAAKDQAAWKSR